MKKEKIKIVDTIGEDGCPCGYYNDGETKMKVHCWRTYHYYRDDSKCDCEFAGVHFIGNKKTAEKIKKRIEEDYHCDVKLVEETDKTLF